MFVCENFCVVKKNQMTVFSQKTKSITASVGRQSCSRDNSLVAKIKKVYKK